MPIESVIQASTDVDLLQAWNSYLAEIMTRSQMLAGIAVRFVVSQRPKLTYEIATGPARADVEGFLNRHPVGTGAAPNPRVVPWKTTIVALEPRGVAAGVYATGARDGDLEEAVGSFTDPKVLAALEHSHRLFDKDVNHIKRVTMYSKHPCLLIDEHRHIHAMNLLAKNLLHSGAANVSVSPNEQLNFGTREASRMFAEMVEAFFRGAHEEARTLLENDLLGHLSRERSSWVSGEHLALLHLKPLRQPLVLDPMRVSKVTKLSIAQARLVCGLVRGLDLRQYAEEANVALPTVRWHMRKVLSHLECTSQYQVVALMKEIFG